MNNSIYLIGDINENFVGRKLPIVKEVMSVFFYEHTFLKKTIKESSKSTITKVNKIWCAAEIPTCGLQYATTKLTKIFNCWKLLQKNCKQKKFVAQKKKRNFFYKN